MDLPNAPAALESLISAERIQQRIGELGRRIAVDYPWRGDGPCLHLVGVLKGSVFFLADLARAIGHEISLDFLGISSYGAETETSGKVRLTKDLDEDIAGRDVLLVEDIIDTGLTVEWLCRHLRQRAPRSLRVAALLDKPSRRVRPVELAYVGFEVPDVFVVGYGLDYAQRYRNLPGVYVLGGSAE
jgi:hypoxanthine phosphoribosyltransferase